MIHWDVKPENIMFDKEGIVKLIDFSYSRFLDKEMHEQGAQNAATYEGTIFYSARMQPSKHKTYTNF